MKCSTQTDDPRTVPSGLAPSGEVSRRARGPKSGGRSTCLLATRRSGRQEDRCAYLFGANRRLDSSAPMLPARIANPLAGEPPTGEPYAGKLPVRFGGRGKSSKRLLPTPIMPARTVASPWMPAFAGMTDLRLRCCQRRYPLWTTLPWPWKWFGSKSRTDRRA